MRDERFAAPLLVSGLLISGLEAPAPDEPALKESGLAEFPFGGLVFVGSVVAESGSALPFESCSVVCRWVSSARAFLSVLVSGGAVGACSAGAGWFGGACGVVFAEPAASCCREAIPKDARLSASATAKADRMM